MTAPDARAGGGGDVARSTPAGLGAPRVEAGAVVALRLFDVAYEIDLALAESLIADRAPASVARIRLIARAEPRAIAFDVPPLEVALGPVELEVAGRTRTLEAVARVYDFGVISVALRLPVSDLSWDEYVEVATELERVAGDEATTSLWRTLLDGVREPIRAALDRPTAAGLEEDYLLSIVRRFDRPMTGEDVLRQIDLAALLTAERRPLSESARRDVLRYTFSYHADDLAVLTWDHAFLLEPAGERDVADVLEVANAQLLELRYYDELLDEELPRMYDRVEDARRTLRGLARRRYADLARDLHTLVAEVTEITEKVDNALEVTGDVYLARVYGAAIELFRVPVWAAAVDRKLAIIRDTYQALYDEAATARTEILEAAIVILIVLEILLAFVF